MVRVISILVFSLLILGCASEGGGERSSLYITKRVSLDGSYTYDEFFLTPTEVGGEWLIPQSKSEVHNELSKMLPEVIKVALMKAATSTAESSEFNGGANWSYRLKFADEFSKALSGVVSDAESRMVLNDLVKTLSELWSPLSFRRLSTEYSDYSVKSDGDLMMLMIEVYAGSISSTCAFTDLLKAARKM